MHPLPKVKKMKLPLLVICVAVVAAPLHAQQRGATSDPQRPGAPDTGLRRAPPPATVTTPAAPPLATAPNPAPTALPRSASPAPAAAATRPAESKPIVTEGPTPKSLPAPPPRPLADTTEPVAGPKLLSAAEAAALGAALRALEDGRYGEARGMVANFRNALLIRVVDWHFLRVAPKTEADFASTWRMLRDSPDWPEPEVLRRQAEDRLGAETPATEVFRYFTAFPPLTSVGHMRRMEAAQAVNPKELAKFAIDSWRTATFRPADEDKFLNFHGPLLSADDHLARFDRILREGRPQAAVALLSKLPPDYQPIAQARLAMATKAADAATILRGVPAAKLNEPVLRLERIGWLRRAGNLEEAKTLLVMPTPDQTEAWWNERQQVARELLAAGKPADAYAVTVPHGQTKGVAFAEAEFLAGWIALRNLKKPADALKHFQTLHDGVTTDISRSRAAYWLGRAQEAANKPQDATEWYRRAANHGQTFYGQLAARKVPGTARHLPKDPVPVDADRQSLNGRELATVARYIAQAGDFDRTRPFLMRLARLITGPGETVLLAQLATELKRPDLALAMARRGSEGGINLFDAAFPVIELGPTGSVERALALAVSRQESAFNAAAISSSGALGLMQLLPGTARDVAGRLNTPFIQDKLTRDPGYNVTLGSQYLAEMLQRFGGSYEIALAAYNAGPNRVARWLETTGDPRSGKIDMVDWIESIPFRETRNYVQRIMEGLAVYRDRLNGPHRTVPPALGRT